MDTRTVPQIVIDSINVIKREHTNHATNTITITVTRLSINNNAKL